MNKDPNVFNPYASFPFAGPQTNPFKNATGAFHSWMRYISSMQNEAMDFGRQRFRRDVGALERFARCRTPEEYIEVQANFIADMYSDYAKESVKIGGLLMETVKQAREKFVEQDANVAGVPK